MFVDLKMKNFGLKFNFTPKLWAMKDLVHEFPKWFTPKFFKQIFSKMACMSMKDLVHEFPFQKRERS